MTGRGSRFSDTFSSLRHRNYRLYFTGQMLSTMGTWMQTIAQGLLVLKLTNNGFQLGASTSMRFLPVLFLGPLGGLWVDRMNKRRLLYFTQTSAGVVAAGFAVLTGTGLMRMWMVYVLAFVLGSVNSIDNPARQSLIPELVPPADIGNAVALNSVQTNVARIVGGAVGGVVVAIFGLTWCFALNGISYIAVLICVGLMRRAEMYPAVVTPREPGQLREGFRYVRSTPELAVPLMVIAVVGTMTWEFPITLPLLNAHIFHRGGGSYGAMTVVMSAGAVLGGLFVAFRGRTGGRTLAFITIAWGIATCALGEAPSYAIALVLIIPVGIMSIAFNAQAKTTVQLATAPMMRGRVMAIWQVCWAGSTPIGGPIVGLIGQELGARWALIAGGVPAVIVAVVAYPALARIDHRAREVTVAHDVDTEEATISLVEGDLASKSE